MRTLLMAEIIQEQAIIGEQPAGESNPSVVGDLRLHEFQSHIFGNRRMLRVWLPPEYDDPVNLLRYYPVFYLNDGQNLFDRGSAYTGVEWQVDETADRLIREKAIPPMILVGIDNAQKDRPKEYLSYRSLNPPQLRPQGKRYPDFLINEVMPFLYERYRIGRGPENTGLGGSSLGAIISLYTVMDRPGVFGRLLLESPSLFISNRQLLKHSLAVRQWPEKIFLAIGTRETGNEERDKEIVDDVRELEHILRRAGLGEERLLMKIDEGATHSEGDWARRFPGALKFLFEKKRNQAM
ncbi:MAG TPA: alpha/beta hydrolase-fold protein [Terriglobales bacterium]|nr:alpha/beta hydrolase-fold protein [Terriglobales bacterium]